MGHFPAAEGPSGLSSTGGSPQATHADAAQERRVSLPQESPQLSQDIPPDWLELLQHYSQLVMAIIDVKTYTILFANDYFCRLMSTHPEENCIGVSLLQYLSEGDQTVLRHLFRRHILNAVLTYRYGAMPWIESRLLNEPIVVTLEQQGQDRPQQIELRLRCDRTAITHLDAALAEALDACWQGQPDQAQVMSQLLTPDSPLKQVVRRLIPSSYIAEGTILLEGMDVTDRETAKSLVQLLINRESILQPNKFGRANRLMQQLFEADGSLILSAETDQAKLFMHLDRPEWETHTFPVKMLQSSLFFQATEQGRVLNIPDLSQNCPTGCEQTILAAGVRSLLIIPLVIKSAALTPCQQCLFGLVGITSSQPYAFNQADCSHATTLIPALTAAMRHSVQDRFINIHASVRWRFEQEAERRSWGLPPTAIVFEGVYPLYGISDIRGSSEERNRAIQADLMTQFQLAIAILDAVCETTENALVLQVREDLHEHWQTLAQGITVDAEVTLLRYLEEAVERHFDFFGQCGAEAEAAIAVYRSAQHPEQGCVYQARAMYDQTIHQINTRLRQTWNHWQKTMQATTQHYCDIEATDGIDHMIYAGQSIDSQFTEFHLDSLRYDQLRAVCDCARASFQLKDCCHTDLEVTHLVLVQASTVDITHDENTERLFDVRGTRDTRYEIVKKRIDKACDAETRARITQPGMLTIVYSTQEEWQAYQRYLRYLYRQGWVSDELEMGLVEPLQGVSGLKFARVRVLPESDPI